MTTLEAIVTIAVAFLGGAMTHIISSRNERWRFKAEREAAKEDKQYAKADRTNELSAGLERFEKSEAQKNQEIDDRLTTLESAVKVQMQAQKLILLDRILYLGKCYIKEGEISFDDRRRLHEMHDCYHTGLGGNGDADLVMDAVDALPLKK